jgi:hypothetical protein
MEKHLECSFWIKMRQFWNRSDAMKLLTIVSGLIMRCIRMTKLLEFTALTTKICSLGDLQ